MGFLTGRKASPASVLTSVAQAMIGAPKWLSPRLRSGPSGLYLEVQTSPSTVAWIRVLMGQHVDLFRLSGVVGGRDHRWNNVLIGDVTDPPGLLASRILTDSADALVFMLEHEDPDGDARSWATDQLLALATLGVRVPAVPTLPFMGFFPTPTPGVSEAIAYDEYKEEDDEVGGGRDDPWAPDYPAQVVPDTDDRIDDDDDVAWWEDDPSDDDDEVVRPEVDESASEQPSTTGSTAAQVGAPPPGWYPAPDGSGVNQWWTGEVWGPKQANPRA